MDCCSLPLLPRHFLSGREKAQRVIDLLDQNGGPLTDGGRLWPIHVRPETGASSGSVISFGAMGDSFYE